MAKKIIIAFLIISTIYIFINPTFYDLTSSIIPGWHTNVISPVIIFNTFILPWLFIVSVGYLYILRKKQIISRKIWIAHLALSLPMFVVFTLKSLFISQLYNDVGLLQTISGILLLTVIIYIIGQLYFITQLIKTAVNKSKTRD